MLLDEGDVGIFGFGHFLGRFFGFFGFVGRCGFRFFGFLAPGFLAQVKQVIDSSLGLCAVRILGYFICLYFTVNPGQIAMWDSGFLIGVS